MKKNSTNNRILIIDDEDLVRDTLVAYLVPTPNAQKELLSDAAGDLFDDFDLDEDEPAPVSLPAATAFLIDEAPNGPTGLEMVQAAIEQERPYAVIFLDMRMPGWDGLRTCEEIRRVDRQVQVFFLTAFTDHSLKDIAQKVGPDVGFLAKPFSQEEIVQTAIKGMSDWDRIENLENLLSHLGDIVPIPNRQEVLFKNILHQIVDYVGAHAAALIKLTGKDCEFLAEVGRVKWQSWLEQHGNGFNQETSASDIFIHQGVMVCPLPPFFVLVALENQEPLRLERSYLLHLFLRNASWALNHAELQQQLLQKEKLSAIGQAISMVMHDIKGPVGQVISTAELMEEEADDPDAIKEMLEWVKDAANRAMDMLQDFRDFTQNRELDRAPHDFSQLIEKVKADFRTYPLTEEVELITETSEAFWIDCDARKLQRVLQNLINNALEALHEHKVSQPAIHLRSWQEGEEVFLEIADNGPGIPDSLLPKLFEPFVTHGKADGTGLGLAIVKQIIEAHQGRIEVRNAEQGAVFTLSFPLSVRSPA